ncbi:MAG TPA: DUF4856 domain-containing protein [Ferruginibacter sp.]|jgi:hypothetical protein|nr:DUF4856 domain-containing protein [Ferruginibacter sp.]
MKKITFPTLAFLIMTCCVSCTKTTTNTIYYTVPATYTFTNVNDSNQLMLLAMADQIVATVNLGNASGVVVNAQVLTDMFNNTGGYFNDSAHQLNASGLRLADYCSPLAKTDLLNYFDSIGVYSQSIVAASYGVAGVSPSSASPSKKYLLSPTGIFYSQVIKKAIMGGICAYEIANVYMTDSVSNSVDNNTVVPGSGTAMQHHWDEAFGFFGVPVNFPTSTTGLKYFGSYSNQVDAGLHSNSTIMNAFLLGRAAIDNKDLGGKQVQANIIIRTFDQLDAAAIVQEMKETDENINLGDSVAAYGTLSESLGFVRNLKYNTSSTRIITNAQIAQLEALYDNVNPANPNLYNFVGASVNTAAQIEAKTDAIRQLVGSIYGFNATELSLL